MTADEADQVAAWAKHYGTRDPLFMAYCRLRADLAAAVGERDAMRKALKPFAELEDVLRTGLNAKHEPSDQWPLFDAWSDSTSEVEVNCGHVRAAAAAYRSASKGELDAWQPISTAPEDGEAIFWLDWSDECALLNPPLPLDGSGRTFKGKNRTWPSIFKATHWQPLPAPPDAALRPAGDQAKGGGS